jgi:hypothetical protein
VTMSVVKRLPVFVPEGACQMNESHIRSFQQNPQTASDQSDDWNWSRRIASHVTRSWLTGYAAKLRAFKSIVTRNFNP